MASSPPPPPVPPLSGTETACSPVGRSPSTMGPSPPPFPAPQFSAPFGGRPMGPSPGPVPPPPCLEQAARSHMRSGPEAPQHSLAAHSPLGGEVAMHPSVMYPSVAWQFGPGSLGSLVRMTPQGAMHPIQSGLTQSVQVLNPVVMQPHCIGIPRPANVAQYDPSSGTYQSLLVELSSRAGCFVQNGTSSAIGWQPSQLNKHLPQDSRPQSQQIPGPTKAQPTKPVGTSCVIEPRIKRSLPTKHQSETVFCEDVEEEELLAADDDAELKELGLDDAEDDETDEDDDSVNTDEEVNTENVEGYESLQDVSEGEDEGQQDDEDEESENEGDGGLDTTHNIADSVPGQNEDNLQYELYSFFIDDNGCVSSNRTYKRRKRVARGAVPPDCRKPNTMGAIEKAMRNSKSRQTTHIFEPVLGMVFDSRAEAYQFYNLYSWEVGFGIRFGNSSRNRVNKYRTMQQLVCEREGFDPRCTSSSKRSRCKAMIRLHRTEDHGWFVSRHVAEHNHPLSLSCGEKREWNSHSKIEQCTMDMIRYLRENNVTLSRVHCIMGSLFGSMEDVPFSQKTLRAVCAQIARDQRDDDVTKTLRIFRKMRQEDPGFQFAVDTDENNKIKTLIWASGKSRSQWNHFGDVVTFDTTYCTNLYKMPFGMFVGVNNHFQSVLFAGVLMRDEKAKSFKWVFNEFLTLMGGKHPKTILTDQCKAMAKAIRLVMPGSTHLWCKWHVLKTAREELGPIYRVNSAFRQEFHYIINEMLTIDEFERAWDDLLERYDLRQSPFMERTYQKRKMWAKPWNKNIYCARMTSTQRSESANSILKKVVPRNSSMNRFVEQYRKLLWLRSSKEVTAEHETKQFQYRAKRVYAVEKHAFEIYTKKVFLLFKCEIDKAAQYHVEFVSHNEYCVIHNNDHTRKHWARGVFTVTVEEVGARYNCECGLYDHFGMLCCHALKVMIHTGVKVIPEAHILKRWTRLATDTIYSEGVVKDSADAVANQLKQNLLYGDALDLVRKANNDSDIHDIVARNLKNTAKEIERLMEWRTKQPGYTDEEQFVMGKYASSDDEHFIGNSYGASGSSAYMSDSDIESMQAPDVIRGKGRPRANRYPHPSEKKKNVSKKKSTNLPEVVEELHCQRFNKNGHTRGTCRSKIKVPATRFKKKTT